MYYPLETDEDKEVPITQGDDKDYIDPNESYAYAVNKYEITNLFADTKTDKVDEE